MPKNFALNPRVKGDHCRVIKQGRSTARLVVWIPHSEVLDQRQEMTLRDGEDLKQNLGLEK